MKKRALISLYDKEGILEFAKFLEERNVEIVSTGGTFKYLKENRISVIDVSSVTNFPEMLDGRVKTLHPNIHGGILALRDNENHMATLQEHNINTIDYVIVNLYPFFEKVKEDLTFDEKVEFIDIGGPTMIRSAAKNFKQVTVITDKNDYKVVMKEIEEQENVSLKTRKYLASKVFNLMGAYDSCIANFLMEDSEEYPEYLTLSYKKSKDLRYGENPHQKAVYYADTVKNSAMNSLEILSGKELSYNNIKDLDIAWKVVCEFHDEVACCALKHNTPCGVAIGNDVYDSYMKAYECDKMSIFGGIVALNRTVDEKTAREMNKIFLEIVAAPDFTDEALKVLKEKKNLRVIKCLETPKGENGLVSVDGGILMQNEDREFVKELKVVTEKSPTEEEFDELRFAMKVCKYVKSNAIVVSRNKMAVGIGGGQVNRIWAAKEALERGENAVALASDAYFPFSDVVEECSKYNIKSIIQPGGSIHDEDSIKACNKLGISMVFTSMRHFKH